jgi:two-component system alkaline phosphatase synthesis response regulator PhoP
MTDVTRLTTLDRYHDCHLLVNFQTKAVMLDGHTLILTRKEFDLLEFLVRRSGELVSRMVLLTVVWEYKAEIRTRTIDVHIRHLRQSLGRYGKRYIETIPGKGYRFQPC